MTPQSADSRVQPLFTLHFFSRMAEEDCEGLMWCSQPPPRSQSMWRTCRTWPLSSWAHPTMAMCTRTLFRWVAGPLSPVSPLCLLPCPSHCPGPPAGDGWAQPCVTRLTQRLALDSCRLSTIRPLLPPEAQGEEEDARLWSISWMPRQYQAFFP